MTWWRDLRPAILAGAPGTLALLTAAAGIMLLASGATPTDPGRFVWILEHAPTVLVEISHFLSSIIGIVLILLAFGLSRRLDGAWWATLVLSLVAAILALTKGFNWEESIALLVLVGLLAPCHEAFHRRARLSRLEITPGWLLSAVAAVAGAGLAGWWSFQHLDYANVSVLKVIGDQDAERALRSSVGAAVVLLGVGVWRLLATPATPPVVGEEDPDFRRVREVLTNAEVAEPASNLALRGDKRFLFSDSGESFLMFGVRGRSWIALGSPVGRRDERLDLLWAFRELADSHAARPGVYGVGPDDLPDLVELGFSIQKVGESAAVPLDTFSLEGRKRGNLRRSWRKTGEGGACFEVAQARWRALRLRGAQAVSDQWLAHHAGGEKTFSLGGFEPAYIAEFPIAVVRVDGKVAAFATLWTTAQRDRLLHRPDALCRRRAQGRDGLPVRRAHRVGERAGLRRLRVRHGSPGRPGGSAPGADHVPRRPSDVRTRRGDLQFPGRAPLQGQVRPAVAASLHRRAQQVGHSHSAGRRRSAELRRHERPWPRIAPGEEAPQAAGPEGRTLTRLTAGRS